MDLGTPHLTCDRPAPSVLRVTLDRPERMNACTAEMYAGLRVAVREAEADPGVRVLLLTGRDPAFCAGGDLRAGAARERTTDPEALARRLQEVLPFWDLERSRVPVVAAVNGPALGGGLVLVLLADVAVASERATFCAPELRHGVADAWVTTRLPAAVGLARARWMLLTGATVGAAEAERIGLVVRVVPHGELERASLQAAAEIGRAAPGAVAAARRAFRQSLPPPDLEGFVQTLSSPEAAEGMRAFAEGRTATWTPPAAPAEAPPGSGPGPRPG